MSISAYTVTVRWQRGEQPFTDNRYSRGHTWSFDGGTEVAASSSPHIVPVPYSRTDAVDPEEAFVASLSSCHMLWFLSIAAKHGYCVDTYVDNADGIMDKDALGRTAITQVTLRPKVAFAGSRMPPASEIDAMHHSAHTQCFIANSVKTEVLCRPDHAGDGSLGTTAHRLAI